MKRFDVGKLHMYSLSQRRHKLRIEDIAVGLEASVPEPPGPEAARLDRCAERIRQARTSGKPVILTFGAHFIKNGLGPLAATLVETGWINHLATNGAGCIHDWEFAFIGQSTEDVRANTAEGRFGTWDETGRYTHLAIAIGGTHGLGYGESMGKLTHDEHLDVPEPDRLRERIAAHLAPVAHDILPAPYQRAEAAAADADLLALIERWHVEPGRLVLPHPWRRFSLQWTAYRCGVPFTVHPGIGYDIIYTHPMASGGAIGRAALRDFHTYAGAIADLTNGVHLAVGSAVMAPMIFEKALSMANNAALNAGCEPIHDHYLAVVDIQDGGGWDWTTGEPPMDHPAYYLRFCKTFYRMGGQLDYIQLDNVVFMVNLARRLLAG